MDDAGYGALAIALTVASGAYTWWAYRTKGLGPGLRGVALTLLVVAAYLTRTMRMFGRVVDAVVDWAVSLVFSPTVWVGIALAGVAVVVFLGSRLLDGRAAGDARGTPSRRAAEPARPPRGEVAAPAPEQRRGAAPIDDDLADIEAILRDRGIS